MEQDRRAAAASPLEPRERVAAGQAEGAAHAPAATEHQHADYDNRGHDADGGHGGHGDHAALFRDASGCRRAGFVLSPAVGAILMSASTVIVALNAQLLRHTDLRRSSPTD